MENSFSDQIKEEIESIAETVLKSRLGDPIIGTYSLSFLIYNWRILIVFFSSKDVDAKINHISNILKPPIYWPINSWDKFLTFLWALLTHPLLVPLLLSLLILFVIPIFLRKLYLTILDLQVTKANDKFSAQEKLDPIKKKVNALTSALDLEKQRVEDLLTINKSLESNIDSLKITQKEIEKSRHKISEELEQFKSGQSGILRDPELYSAVKTLEDQNLIKTFKFYAQQFTLTRQRMKELLGSSTSEADNITKLLALNFFKKEVIQGATYLGLSPLGSKVFAYLISAGK